VGSCEQGNGYSGAMKCREFVDQPRDYQLLKKETAKLKLNSVALVRKRTIPSDRRLSAKLVPTL
jgi:hypothetical protein